MPKTKTRVDPGERFFRDDEFERVDKPLHPEPESPYETTFVSPSMVKLEGRPAFDILAPEFLKPLTTAFLRFVLGGPREFTSTLVADRTGLLTFEYIFTDPKTRKASRDFWDYQGPMKLQVKTRFLGNPLGASAKPALRAIQKMLLAGGYDETDPEMRKFESVLSKLRTEMTHKVTNFSTNKFWIPFAQKRAYRLQDQEFVKKVLAADPELHIYWKDT